MRVPLIKAAGSHYDVGCRLGQAAAQSIQEMHAHVREEYGNRWFELLEMTGPFLAATERHLPRVVEELRGAASGCGVPFDDLFLMSIEELLYEEVRGDKETLDSESSSDFAERPKGCTDLAAGPPATAGGHVWLAHNNDLGAGAGRHLFVTQIQADGEPEIMAVTVGGIFISIGFNSAAISLTGNQLYPNDSCVGVPRLLMVRDILAQTTFDAALVSATLPDRASSYNNLIASEDGRIVNVEGSATDCDLLWARDGTTYHTNHYLSDKMKRYEAAKTTVASGSRCSRAAYYANHYRGRIDRSVCESFLRDHVFAPWGVCRHSGDSVTVFSSIINLNERTMWLARGNPCREPYEEYHL